MLTAFGFIVNKAGQVLYRKRTRCSTYSAVSGLRSALLRFCAFSFQKAQPTVSRCLVTPSLAAAWPFSNSNSLRQMPKDASAALSL